MVAGLLNRRAAARERPARSVAAPEPRTPTPVFLIPSVLALACAPAILLAERLDWTEAPFHLTQMLATLLCFPTSVAYLVLTRKRRKSGSPTSPLWTGLAWAAAMSSAGWLAFLALVVLMFMRSDF